MTTKKRRMTAKIIPLFPKVDEDLLKAQAILSKASKELLKLDIDGYAVCVIKNDKYRGFYQGTSEEVDNIVFQLSEDNRLNN